MNWHECLAVVKSIINPPYSGQGPQLVHEGSEGGHIHQDPMTHCNHSPSVYKAGVSGIRKTWGKGKRNLNIRGKSKMFYPTNLT